MCVRGGVILAGGGVDLLYPVSFHVLYSALTLKSLEYRFSGGVQVIRQQATAVQICLLLIGLLLHGTVLLAHVFSNLGALSFRDALLVEARRDTSRQPSVYALFGALDRSDIEFQTALFQRAAVLDPSSLAVRWMLARTALAIGDAGTAVEHLRLITDQAEHNQFLFNDALIAFCYAGMPDQAVALYESNSFSQTVRTADGAVAVAYLELGGHEALERVKRLRPDDLYANYHLWKKTQRSGDPTTAAAYSETLICFPLEAISPADERLLEYATEVIPALLDEGLWDRAKTLNVVSFLVWWRYEARSVERLLERLVERYPTESDWLFFLAELYHRQGNLNRAEVTYRQVLAADPMYAQSYLRLGMVTEAKFHTVNANRQVQLEEVVEWYERYHEIALNDLLGLKKLTEMSETLGRPGAVVLRNLLTARADDRYIVAQMVDVPVEAVELGPNLVENSGFEEWVGEKPEWWAWSAMFNREPFDAAAFVGGADELSPFERQRMARVEGFWMQQQEGNIAARAGFWHCNDIPLAANTPYILSFQYRTSRIPDGKVTVWVSSADEPDVFWSGGDYGLPSTDGEWHHFVAIGWNRSDAEAAIRPLLRSFAPGCVEFDDVQVRQIGLPEGIALEQGETQFRVTGRNN